MSLMLLGILNAQVAGIAGSVAGYVSGGTDGSEVATVDKFAFPSDSRTTLGTGLSSARRQSAGMSNPSVAGYNGGGTT